MNVPRFVRSALAASAVATLASSALADSTVEDPAGSSPCITALAPAPPPAPVADASERGDLSAVKTLLADGADPLAAQPGGMTALHWAVYHDRPAISEILLDHGADPNAKTRYAITPLSLAAINGNAATLESLLAAGADLDQPGPGGESVLMLACRTGIPEAVERLLQRGASVDATDQRGQTALMWAAAEGHAPVVRLLLQAGADLHLTLNSGFNALFFAVRQGQAEVVQALLEAGADVNQVMQPRRRGSPKDPDKGMSPLLLATENGHFELAAALLDAGADANDMRSGFTALHTLTWVRKPNRGDDADGDPSPVGSGRLGSLDLVRQLVAHGADVNARLERRRTGPGRLDHRGATPLLLASKTADLAYIRLLLELGGDPLLGNDDGATPLMAAAGLGTLAPGEEAGTEEEALATVRFLMDHGAEVDTVDANGETAMHGAAYKSLPRMVALLDEAGASIDLWNRPNRHSWTPLLIARGYRPGNFKPSEATIQAIESVMQSHGIPIPPDVPPKTANAYP